MNDVRARFRHLPSSSSSWRYWCIAFIKKNYTLYAVVCAYMLLFLLSSSSLSITIHRYIQRGLYNQGKNRTVGSVQCSYFLLYSPYDNIACFVLSCLFLHIYCLPSMVFELSQDNCFFLCWMPIFSQMMSRQTYVYVYTILSILIK